MHVHVTISMALNAVSQPVFEAVRQSQRLLLMASKDTRTRRSVLDAPPPCLPPWSRKHKSTKIPCHRCLPNRTPTSKLPLQSQVHMVSISLFRLCLACNLRAIPQCFQHPSTLQTCSEHKSVFSKVSLAKYTRTWCC